MRRALALAAVAVALTAVGVASADAASDVREMRAGKLPLRAAWLGWDAANQAHFRTVTCSDGGTVTCSAALLAQPADAPAARTSLLQIAELDCGPCDALDAKTVADFVKAEKVGMAALPPLTKGTHPASPTTLFGTIAGGRTAVEVRARDLSTPEDEPNLEIELVLRGNGGATETLGTLQTRVFRLNSARVRDAFVSGDGTTAAFVVESHYGVMCWDFDALTTVGVRLAGHKARLANTIGLRAYKGGDMTVALADFTEATRLDPSYALGWYNKAAVESRGADVTSARASFEAAARLSPGLAARACTDLDFASLRAADPARFACKP